MTPHRGSNGVCLIGESLGYHEAKQGKPFIGPAGFILGRALQRFGLLRENFDIANLVWCRPPNDSLKGWDEAISHCYHYLEAFLEERRPKVLVPLGEHSLHWIQGLHGISACRGYVFQHPHLECWVVPSFHPSFIQRGANRYIPVLATDLARAVGIAQGGWAHEQPVCLMDPNPERFKVWVEQYETALRQNPTLPLAADIETPYKSGKGEGDLSNLDDPTFTILRISFAFNREEGVTVPWSAPWIPLIQRLLGSQGVKIFWNGRGYDCIRIRANAVKIEGLIRDSMEAWHTLNSDLDKDLGFVAPFFTRLPMWKHLSGTNPTKYSVYDAIALWGCDQGIVRALHAEGLWDIYERQIQQLNPILDQMSATGMLIDQAAREALQEAVSTSLTEVEEKIQDAVPETLKPKKRYAKERPETHPMTGERMVQVCEVCGLVGISKAHGCIKDGGTIGRYPEQVTQWEMTLPFVPSTPQLLRYARHLLHPLYTNYKSGTSTMDEESLKQLLKKVPDDPLYPLVLQQRELGKILHTYIEGKGFAVHEDGRVHTHFTHNPSTLRLASEEPNLQNIPTGLGSGVEKAIRNLFIASPGCLLWKRDFRGIEAVLVGYLARDPIFLRLTRLGVHAFFASHVLGRPAELSWSDADLAAYFQTLKKQEPVVYDACKRTVYLSLYLGTPRRMRDIYPELFPSEKEARRYQEMFFSLFPTIPRWQHQTCALADQQGYLRAPDGFPHRFWRVYDYKKERGTWEKRLGQDAKRAVAFVPQHMAMTFSVEAALRLQDDPLVRPALRLFIHDELLGESPEQEVEEVLGRVKEAMEQPHPQLPLDISWGMGEYLRVETEGASGTKWGEMT